MPNSYVAVYRPIHKGTLLGGVKESRSSRFQRKQDAELRLKMVIEANNFQCEGKVIPSESYPEIFIHCGTIPQCVGGRCFGCGKTLTVEDAKNCSTYSSLLVQ